MTAILKSLNPLNPTKESSIVLPLADFEVTYGEHGFEPSFLEVPLGSKVAFKNSSSIPLHTASDPHPTHSDYADFDAKRDYASSETYHFKFEHTGTFGYHNHKRSIDRGFIRVFDPVNPTPDIDKTRIEQRVLRDKLLEMLKPGEPDTLFKVVDAIVADASLSLNCHDIAHDIGHRAYEFYGFSNAMTFSNPEHLKHPLVQYICAGGYVHGITEELALNLPTFKTEPSLVCAGVPEDDRPSCLHGIGHALMFVNHRNIQESLYDCRAIEMAKDRYRCFEGAWMELYWGNTDHTGAGSLGWDLEKPLQPCINAKKDEKPTCYLYVTFGYLRTHVKDYGGAVRMCTKSELADVDVEFCLKGLGITMMSKFKGKHLEGSEVYVVGLSNTEKSAFYKGVLGYARLSGISANELGGSCDLFKTDKELCKSALLESH